MMIARWSVSWVYGTCDCETWHFLKSGSRVIALADYRTERPCVLAVRHRMLLGDDESLSAADVAEPKTGPLA
jgi:hypothetical protein